MICYRSMIGKAYLTIGTWRFTMSSIYDDSWAKLIANSCRNIFCTGSISLRSLLSRHWSQQYLLADQTLVSKRSGHCLRIKYKTCCPQVPKNCWSSKRESYEWIFLILRHHKIIFVPKFWQNIEPGNGRIIPARNCPFRLHTFFNVIVRCNFLPNGTFLCFRVWNFIE